MGDLFGFLFLFLIEEKTVEEATEEYRVSARNAVVDHQSHALCCFQGMRLCLVLFYRPDGETPSCPHFEREAVVDERALLRDGLRRWMGEITMPKYEPI